MYASRVRSLKRDGRDHSLSMNQPVVVSIVLARDLQPAASLTGLWYHPLSYNDLALLACVVYPYCTVSITLTYLQYVATPPTATIFYFDKACHMLYIFFWINLHRPVLEPQQVSTTSWSLGVCSMPVEYSYSVICDRDWSGYSDVSDTELSQACDVLVQQTDGLADRHVVAFSDVSDTEWSAALQAVEDSYICCRSQGVLAADDRALTRLVNARSSAAKTAYNRALNKICCTVHGLKGAWHHAVIAVSAVDFSLRIA